MRNKKETFFFAFPELDDADEGGEDGGECFRIDECERGRVMIVNGGNDSAEASGPGSTMLID